MLARVQLENFMLKRGVVGNYHQVSKKYLPLYLAEFHLPARPSHRLESV